MATVAERLAMKLDMRSYLRNTPHKKYVDFCMPKTTRQQKNDTLHQTKRFAHYEVFSWKATVVPGRFVLLKSQLRKFRQVRISLFVCGVLIFTNAAQVIQHQRYTYNVNYMENKSRRKHTLVRMSTAGSGYPFPHANIVLPPHPSPRNPPPARVLRGTRPTVIAAVLV